MVKIECGAPSRITLMALDDHQIIGYRPRLTAEIGSVLSTLVVCQAMYWAQHGGNPFYKFIEPCRHHNYRQGDSWVEELGFTRHEFLFAIKRVAQKISKKSTIIDRDAFIWYWTDISRVTWYEVNWERVNRAFDQAYPVNPESGFTKIQKVDLPKSDNSGYVNPESGFTYKEQRLTSENNQSSSSAETCCVVDDDDLYRDLLDLGLSPTLAKEVLTKNERVLVQHKLQDMLAALKTGKIKNMIGYAMKVFTQELYSPAQADRIINRRTEKPMARIATKEPEADIQIEIPDMSKQQLADWENHIYGNKVLWKIYQARGTDSPMIRTSMKQFLEEK